MQILTTHSLQLGNDIHNCQRTKYKQAEIHKYIYTYMYINFDLPPYIKTVYSYNFYIFPSQEQIK